MSLELAVFVLCVAIGCMGLRIIEEPERLVVFRLGRPSTVLHPGLRWVVPFVDKAIRVNLGRALPAWETLADSEVDEQLIALARTGQLPAS